jgi:hypothetical protein
MPNPVKRLRDVKKDNSDFLSIVYCLAEFVVDFNELGNRRVSW